MYMSELDVMIYWS